MAWNEPGNGKDPWDKDKDEPIELDKIVQGWQRKLSSVVGGGRGGAAPGSSGGYVLIVLLALAWLATGLYRVDEAERGVVQRFGAYTDTTMPGLHWHIPFPIEFVDIVNVQAVDNFPFRTEMLTADRQYVFIQMVVQYRRTDPVKYSFEVVEPELTLQDVTESALREVVGTSTLIRLVTEQRFMCRSLTCRWMLRPRSRSSRKASGGLVPAYCGFILVPGTSRRSMARPVSCSGCVRKMCLPQVAC